MLERLVGSATVFLLLAAPGASPALAQNPHDGDIKQIQGNQRFAPVDVTIIKNWIKAEMDRLRSGDTDVPGFLASFRAWRTDPASSGPFKAELARHTSSVVVAALGDPKLAPRLAWPLARVVAGFDLPVTIDALLAGLKSTHSAVRLTCAKGLSRLRDKYAANPAQLVQVVQALGAAGLNEKEAAVLAWIYQALAVPGRASDPAIFGALIGIFDARLVARRAGGVAVDQADLEAFEYLRPGADRLAQPQRVQLVARLAVFLRLAAARHGADEVKFDELVNIERTLDAIEAILQAITTTRGGLRNALSRGARATISDELEAAAIAWVGDADNDGVLTGAPWNVPRGAP